MATIKHLDALTRRHALTLYNSFTLHGQPGDVARTVTLHGWYARQRMLIRNLLPYTQATLLDRCYNLYLQNGAAPTPAEAAAAIQGVGNTSLHSLTVLLSDYDSIVASLPLLDLAGAQDALEAILVALTHSATTPYGPVRRTVDRTLLSSIYGPVLFGTPTERLLLLTLYYVDPGYYLPLSRLHDMLGGSLTALQMAVRTLTQQGIVHRLWESGIGPIVRLAPVFSAAAADERAECSRRLTPAYAAEQLWRWQIDERNAEASLAAELNSLSLTRAAAGAPGVPNRRLRTCDVVTRAVSAKAVSA